MNGKIKILNLRFEELISIKLENSFSNIIFSKTKIISSFKNKIKVFDILEEMGDEKEEEIY